MHNIALNNAGNGKNKGIMLFIVLGVLLIVTVLASVVLNLILSNYRLTHHQTNRIRAYYATMGGINYALEMLRIGNWTVPASNRTNALICMGPTWAGTLTNCNLTDSGLSYDINVTIGNMSSSLGSAPAIAGTAPISANAEFTYTMD